jgi:hypothetical protein
MPAAAPYVNYPSRTGMVAGCLLYLNAKVAEIIEAKRQGATLLGVATQSWKYSKGLCTLSGSARNSHATPMAHGA